MDKTASRRFGVLLINDNPLVTSELRELLEKTGYRCVAATCRESAIASFQADPGIGLVICDLYLGQSNGIRLIESLNEVAGDGRFFESIILGAHDDRQEVIEAMRAGVADYHQKPLVARELLRGLERLENRLCERMRDHLSLIQLNQRLEYLTESLNSIHRDLDRIKCEVRGNSQPGVPPNGAVQPPMPALDDSHAAPPSPLFGKLSPRQQAVARLVSKGLTNYQIAYELGITENTVKLYVSQVLRLMHMHNRTQLALALSPSALRQSSETLVH